MILLNITGASPAVTHLLSCRLEYGNGATYVKDNVINYFDSFGMPPFQEIADHAKEKNLTLLHQNQQIQNLYTSTCGYFCLYVF